MKDVVLTGAGRFVVVTILATLALCTSPVAEACAVARHYITIIVDGSQLIALTGFALGKTVVGLGTLLTKRTSKVSLTRTDSIDSFAVVAIGAIQITLALTTLRT